MGSSQSSFASELLIAGIAVAGTAAVYRYYTTTKTNLSPSSTSTGTKSSKKSKKAKKTESDSEFDKAIAAVRAREETEAKAKAKADANPKVVPFPTVVPGTFGEVESTRQESDADDNAGAQLSKSKAAKKKRKGKKAGDSLAASSSSIAASIPTIPSSATPDIQSDARSGTPTSKPDAKKKKGKKATPPPPPQSLPSPTYQESDVPSSNDAWTRVEQHPSGFSPAQLSRTPTTTTEISSVQSQSASEMPDDVVGTQRSSGNVKRKTLAEKLLPKPRKTGVEDMLETPSYPSVARVMRIKPTTGISTSTTRFDSLPQQPGEEELSPEPETDLNSSWAVEGGMSTGGDDGEDEDDDEDVEEDDDGGWQSVKSVRRPVSTRPTSSSYISSSTSSVRPTASSSVPGAAPLSKKARQNAKRAAAKKEAKQAASEQQQQALKAHKHTLMQTRMDEMYGVKKGGKKGGLSGGMSSGVNERGQLVWDG